MRNSDRRFDILKKSKHLSSKGLWNELIIPERMLDSSTSMLQVEILVSEYASAMEEPGTVQNLAKKWDRKSIPVLFAILEKMIQGGCLKNAGELLMTVIKEQAVHLDNKHMLLYNVVKLLRMQN
jgi:hypothetical protein